MLNHIIVYEFYFLHRVNIVIVRSISHTL